MKEREREFLQRLRATFDIEAEERLRSISGGLSELKKAGGERQKAVVETVFREVHSLKGAARSVGMVEVEAVCQSLESVLAAWRERGVVPSLLGVIQKIIDGLGTVLSAGEATSRHAHLRNLLEQSAGLAAGVSEKIQTKQGAPLREQREPLPEQGTLDLPAASSLAPSETATSIRNLASLERLPADTIRISAAGLNSIRLEAEEMIAVKQTARLYCSELEEIGRLISLRRQESAEVLRAVRQLEKNRATAELTEILDHESGCLKSVEHRLNALVKFADRSKRVSTAMVDNHLGNVHRLLIMPCASLLEIFPRLVRDLARDEGKEIDLAITGGEIEIDRRILDEVKDSLIHLLRNCVSHGIEKPEQRVRLGKKKEGTISITVSQVNGDKIKIAIADDGAGIDLQQVKAAAVRAGVITPEKEAGLSETEAISLIFEGVSTSPVVTNISGRGLGMAIVREKTEYLGGKIAVTTALQRGVRFEIILPLTLAAFRCVLVKASDRTFAIPVIYVERVMRVRPAEVRTVANRETVCLGRRTVSLVSLADVLAIASAAPESDWMPVAVLSVADRQIAFRIEAVLGEEEVVMKSLGKQLSRVRNIAAATLIGSGQVVPVLNVPDLMKSAQQRSMSESSSRSGAMAPARSPIVAGNAGPGTPDAASPVKKILVVEDSITSRMFLKNILESAGYRVKTAVDGIEALGVIQTEEVDLIVSDVDMPRMNGLDLVQRVRKDNRDLPIVLVTALESRQDRERGVEVGANAYIVKSGFDEANLLSAIRRLII